MNTIDLTSILVEKPNSVFRKCEDKNNSGYIFDNAINTARKIVMQLGSNVLRTNHVMLTAKMQSGKTSVCNAVVNIIQKSRLHKHMCINKVLFITGMNDCGLKTQTFERLKEQVFGATDDNIYVGKRSKKNLSKNKYFVLKNSDLLDYDGILDNSLIFIDESHYGSNERNKLTQFLIKHGIDWKNTNDLISRNIYIVSISATPFDELVSDTVECKKMVELETSDDYVGVSDYIKNDLIYDASKDDIMYEGRIFDYIIDAHDRMLENEELGVIFIRTRDFDVIKENAYVETNFNVFEMYASGSKIEYSKLNDKLEDIRIANQSYANLIRCGVHVRTKPLIVLIKGAFRAGITIAPHYKDFIYMVYDYSMKADTTAQALLGRMCGYRSDKKNMEKTYFYINKKYADMYSDWENDFTNRQLIPANKLTWEWVDNGFVGGNVKFGSRSCGNLALNLTDDEILDIYLRNKGVRNNHKIMEGMIPSLFENHNCHIKYDYIGDVYMKGKNHYAQSSKTKRFESFSEDSLVCQFKPDKIKKFQEDTKRDYFTSDDLGKRCISLVLDAEIEEKNNTIEIKGNKRLLIYYVEVGQKHQILNRSSQYKPHKDTKIEKHG